MNILIPMAGAGRRFKEAGYALPKPLIDVCGRPMIQLVVENLNLDGKYTYVVQDSHCKEYDIESTLKSITPSCEIVKVKGITEGAACTTLLAKKFIDNNNPLLFANSDQYVDWNSKDFIAFLENEDIDGGIATFKANHPKWSFAEVKNGKVIRVAEKNPISDIATVGIYWWKKGSEYVKYAEQMIKKNIRVNNEFYVCPVFNEAISDKKIIKTYDVEKMWGLGTPEDLEYFLKNKIIKI